MVTNKEDFGRMVVVFICMCGMIVAFCLFFFFFFLGCQQPPNTILVAATTHKVSFRNVEYVSNYDGDTVTVNLPSTIPAVFSHEIPVRIRGIDAAEMKSSNNCELEMAIRAKEVVTTLLKTAKKIDLEDVGRDKYFRLLAEIVVYDDTKIAPLSVYLIEHGYAVPYNGDTKPKVDWCKMSPMRPNANPPNK